jgi:hypothetical protein
VKAGVETNARNGEGTPALILLTQHFDADALRAALVDGADANAKDDAGRTALDYLRLAGCGKAVVPIRSDEMKQFEGKQIPCP